MSVRIFIGDCRERLRELPDASVDSVVCDPPYELGFMGKAWDNTGIANDAAMWAEVLRVLKPGGHLVAFSGTRTYHRMAVAIEDAGFEIRDQLAWIYGSGFPKSLDVSKAIDKARRRDFVQAALDLGVSLPGRSLDDWTKEGHSPGDKWWAEFKSALPAEMWAAIERKVIGQATSGDTAWFAKGIGDITAPATEAAQQWQGWGTALKPSWEPICLARKPLVGTVAQNVLTHGTGALNIGGCRIEADDKEPHKKSFNADARHEGWQRPWMDGRSLEVRHDGLGRWPANLCHDGSDEVLAGFPEAKGATSNSDSGADSRGVYSKGWTGTAKRPGFADDGSAARFFYCAKATTEERGEGNNHPTVKPVALMRWLCRLVTPKGGTVLDPFMGSGSTALACDAEQFDFIGCELSAEYADIAEQRVRAAAGMFADVRRAA